MKKVVLIVLMISCNLFSQSELKEVLEKYNKETIPYIYVDELEKISDEVILLDAREPKEYKVSHIKNAQFVGYDKFKLKSTIKNLPNKDAKIVVYCSLGVRSEDVAEKLKKIGYTNVSNLYGGIFEWKNNNNKVFNAEDEITEKVHAFDEDWGRWLKKGEKVYE